MAPCRPPPAPPPLGATRPVRSLWHRTLRGCPQRGRPGRGWRGVGEAPAEPYPELGEGDGGSLPLPHSAPAVTSTALLSAVPAKAGTPGRRRAVCGFLDSRFRRNDGP